MHSHIFYNLVMNQKEVHDRLLNSEGPRISRCIKEWNAVGILNICQQFGEDKSRTKKKKKKTEAKSVEITMFFQSLFLRVWAKLVSTVFSSSGMWGAAIWSVGVTGCPVPIWDPQGLQPKGRVLLTALEKQGENQAGRGEIMSSVSDMFSFRRWWDTQVEIFCRQKEIWHWRKGERSRLGLEIWESSAFRW